MKSFRLIRWKDITNRSYIVMVDSSRPGWSFWLPPPMVVFRLLIGFWFAGKRWYYFVRGFPLDALKRGGGEGGLRKREAQEKSDKAKEKDLKSIRDRSICPCHKQETPRKSYPVSTTHRITIENGRRMSLDLLKFFELGTSLRIKDASKRLTFQGDSSLRQCRERKQFCPELLN